MTKIGIIGASGRMGKEIIELIQTTKNLSLGGVCSSSQGSVEEVFHSSDVVIDFSVPMATLLAAQVAQRTEKILVSGTTGFTVHEFEELEKIAKHARIVWASNTSFGVNLLQEKIKEISALLDDQWDVEIVEEHHNKKKDAPSGTALLLGNAVAQGRSQDLKKQAVFSREGVTGERKAGQIGFSAVRCGKVVGDHRIIFDNGMERLEFRHYAYTRQIFAQGAITLALKAKENNIQIGKIHSFGDLFC